MQIAVLKERRAGELRVAASPDSVKKFVAAGCQVTIETGAGANSQISDDAFKDVGATIASDAASAAGSADLVLKIQKPMTAAEGADEISYLKSGSILNGAPSGTDGQTFDGCFGQARCDDLCG